VLVGELEARARDRIAAAAEELDAATWDEPSLDRGAAGAALLFGYLARDGYEDAGGRAAELLESSVAALSSDQVSPWLFAGVTGVAWAIQHLGDVVETEPDALDDIDENVLELLRRDHLPVPVELMEGLVGLGVYALERRPRAVADAVLERAVAHLDATAARAGAAATWRSPPDAGDLDDEERARNPGGYLNLGLAHGHAGVVAFLASAAAAAGGPEGARALLGAATAGLTGHLSSGDGPRLPILVGEGLRPRPPLGGWCAGDLAGAVALVHAGLAAGERAWVDRGRALALHEASAPPADLAARLSDDPTFCHGTAGRAHLLNRLAQATGDDALAAAALDWYGRTLDLCDAGVRGPGERGIRLGAAGVALALLGAVSPVAPDWDRAFLVALPPT
jgi:hypothetical protein